MRILPLLSLPLLSLLCNCTHTSNKVQEREGTYQLISFQEVELPQRPVIIMRIAGDTVSGQGPVNQWSAQVVDGKVDGIISTRRSGTPTLMQLEFKLLTALNGASIKNDGKSGIKLTNGNKTIAVFHLIQAELPR